MSEEKEIKFFLEKTPNYRTIYVDGVYGGVAPKEMINLLFFASRKTIPKEIVRNLQPNGEIGELKSISEDSKEGIIHEIEMGIYINKETAKEIYELLGKIINQQTK